jgi:hypothetical protein
MPDETIFKGLGILKEPLEMDRAFHDAVTAATERD